MNERRCFETSWGAHILDDGRVRFRLWAPAETDLALHTSAGALPMKRDAAGWFEIATDAVAVGEGYAFKLADGARVPDPAARAQLHDVHGLSRLVDPGAFNWRNGDWAGRPWEETVIQELHVGTFSARGTFAGVKEKLDHLVELGITAIEIMPVAQFSGTRGWGYDGVLLYAPHQAYGGPEGLKALVDAAHGRGLMVFLDVVYNHFGPDGNYLHRYAPDFFHPERETPWGPAIAYDKAPVRAFIRDNVLYWLEEYGLDGLRFDAIDQIDDLSDTPILEEVARAVRSRFTDRQIHLATEDARNIVSLHPRDAEGRCPLFTAEWNDDFHNVAHALATGESEGYYRDFASDHWRRLARALAEGFVYQGEPSVHLGGRPRGAASALQPPTAFVNFLQNHDQIGNRAFGERLIDLADRRTVELLTAMLLLGPAIPLLFMGEEWGETRPFCFFTDFHGALAEAVRDGRRREFCAWSAFTHPESRARIPDPNAVETFAASRLDWERAAGEDGRAWLDFYRRLLALRRRELVPWLGGARGGAGTVRAADEGAVAVTWRLGAGRLLHMDANFLLAPRAGEAPEHARVLFALPEAAGGDFLDAGQLAAQSLVVSVTAD